MTVWRVEPDNIRSPMQLRGSISIVSGGISTSSWFRTNPSTWATKSSPEGESTLMPAADSFS